ncbi:MAG: MtN3/saliva family protein [bacterium ADurb.Bin212]|nr:MAG: MtN3/saliva family protein [bacterium ADurb.Bin212]
MPVIGILATVASLMIVLLGLPAQIINNYRRKSCEGLAPQLVYAAVCTYTLWAIYGWTKPDLFLATAQTPGCILSLVLLYQLVKYR